MVSYTRVGVLIMIALLSITMICTTIVQQSVLSAIEQTYEQSRKAEQPNIYEEKT